MLVYRITHKKYSRKLFAPGLAGRWNGSGRKVIYCAESIALAFLENMVRRQGVGFNEDFKIMILEIPRLAAVASAKAGGLKIQIINPDELPAGWRKFTDYSICQRVGNAWYDEGIYSLLKVPSAVLPESFNYVINSTHPAFNKIELVQVSDFIPDERIEALLKNHSTARTAFP
ncbi:MAG: RES family NAD+ phosphorylase [Bacteroidota bacterium]|nr:RES family NAD+ phosphorylase [Bacteroidota bacterium]MDP4213818.1 RES family NAD+ phosphorylase [Bacteroidota bacterium]MDP4248833.1 RES family NAD+ phosphorylase [Bacteroidota bacterium]